MLNVMPVVTFMAQYSQYGYNRRSDEETVAAVFLAILGGMCVGFIIMIAISVAICYILSGFLKKLPPEYRQQQPNMVWLLLIPIFNLIWNFFVLPKISASYKAYFDAQGRTDHGDAGGNLAMAYCILAACSMIPYIGWGCISFVALVVFIIYIIKMYGYKNQVNAVPPQIPPRV